MEAQMVEICLAYMPVDKDGLLPQHLSIKGGKPCRGRNPKEGEYPVDGYDSEPRYIRRGGLPETNRRKF